MENVTSLGSGTYIVAVSGGVDSVVLLDVLAGQNSTFHIPHSKLIVAHFDHGMRADSSDDEQFVAGLAKHYGLEYASERGELGAGASEDTARKARYDFLFRVKKQFGARKIITAHHQDDVIETMMINLIRGTGWRGLCSLRNTAEIVRPFLKVSQADIVAYAKSHDLKWHEDPTNQDDSYLRNSVRHELLPKADRNTWLKLYRYQCALAEQIDAELARFQSNKRYDYIMWPEAVAAEIIKQRLGLTRAQAKRTLTAIKTAAPGTTMTVGGNQRLGFTRDMLVVAPSRS